jgi:hypothetical protein
MPPHGAVEEGIGIDDDPSAMADILRKRPLQALFASPIAAHIGALAQLGERVVRNDEVSGSIPLGSTTIPEKPDFAFKRSPAFPVGPRLQSGGNGPSPARLAVLDRQQ